MGQLGNGVYSSVQTYQQDMTTGIRKIPPPEITGTSLILGVAIGITNLRDAFTTRDFNCMKINLFFGFSGTRRFSIKEENLWIQR